MRKLNVHQRHGIAPAAAVLLASIFLLTAAAKECRAIDGVPPEVVILSPLSGGTVETDKPAITLSGEVDEDFAIQSVAWKVGEGSESRQGYASGSTSDWRSWIWEAPNVPLKEGLQAITITAVDAAGNTGTATLEVVYTPPVQPPQPPGAAEVLAQQKTKMTFYFGGTSYDNLDRLSTVAYLMKDASDTFEMPFNTDVTAVVEIPEPGDPSTLRQIFVQTIPAGTVSEGTKYRYVGSALGIRELLLQSSGSTKIYTYLYIDKWNFLPDLKPIMTSEAYQDYIRSISGCIISIWIGTDRLWRGQATLSVGSYSTHKQELVYNR